MPIRYCEPLEHQQRVEVLRKHVRGCFADDAIQCISGYRKTCDDRLAGSK